MPDSSELAAYARLLKLTPVEGVASAQHAPPRRATAAPLSRGYWQSLWRRRLAEIALSFFCFSGMALCVVYFALLAAPRFESEVRFVVRSPGRAIASSGLGELIQTAGIGRANDDAYAIRDFLLSRDAVRYVEEHAGLRKALEYPRGDFIWRFPNFYSSASDEGLYLHFQRIVSTSFDSTTGISTLRVQAFSAEVARGIAMVLLEAAEGVVNRLNERARRNTVAVAEAEVERLKLRVLTAQAELTNFRTREALLDPSQASIAALEAIARLSLEEVQTRMQITETERTSPQSPQIASMRIRLRSVEDEILSQRRKLAGDSNSVAPKISEYERLSLEREFAERALLSAMSSVELARLEAERQQVYLERISAPSLPDHPSYPYRILWSVVSLLVGLGFLKVGFILISDARGHSQL